MEDHPYWIRFPLEHIWDDRTIEAVPYVWDINWEEVERAKRIHDQLLSLRDELRSFSFAFPSGTIKASIV